MGCWPEQTAFDHQECAKLDWETEELRHNWVALEVGRMIRRAGTDAEGSGGENQ